MSIQYTSDELLRKFESAPASLLFGRLADALLKEGRPEEALELCRDGVRLFPDYLTGFLVTGRCLEALDRLEEAKDHFEHAVKIDSHCLSALRHLRELYEKLQWHSASQACLDELLRREPWNTEILIDSKTLGESSPDSLAEHELEALDSQAAMNQPTEMGSDFGAARPSNNRDLISQQGDSQAVTEFNLSDVGDFLPNDSTFESAFDSKFATETDEVNERVGPTPDSDIPYPGMELGASNLIEEELTENSESIQGKDIEDRLDDIFKESVEEPISLEKRKNEGNAVEEDILTVPLPGAEIPFTEAISKESFDQPSEDIQTDTIRSEEVDHRPEHIFENAAPTLAHDKPESIVADTDPANMLSGRTLEFSIPPLPPEEEELPLISDASGMENTSRVEDEPALASTEQAVEEYVEISQNATETAFVGLVEEDRVSGQDIEDKLDALFGSESETSSKPEPLDPPSPSDTAIEHRRSLEESDYSNIPGPSFLPIQEEQDGKEREFQEKEEPSWMDVDAGATMVLPSFNEEEPVHEEEGDAGGETLFSVEFPDSADQVSNTQVDWGAEENDEPGMGNETLSIPVREISFDEEAIEELFPELNISEPEVDESAAATLHRGEKGMDQGEDIRQSGGEDTVTELIHSDDPNPEVTQEFSPTASLDLVDGKDIGDRLDHIFGSEPTELLPEAPPAMEGDESAPMFFEDGSSEEMEKNGPDVNSQVAKKEEDDTMAPMVSGDDISSRLAEIFGSEPHSVPPGQSNSNVEDELWSDNTLEKVPKVEIEAARQTDEADEPRDQSEPDESSELDKISQTDETEAKEQTPGAEPAFPDEAGEDGDIGEEESDPASLPGTANVATVTLAEIYFQQGLKEQALQIYRQLLEREPENQAVAKRIEEIEATKVDGEGGSERRDLSEMPRRRPRPGVKIPKRKR